MTIKITGCSDPLMWYNHNEGKEYNVVSNDFDEFVVYAGTETNIVKFEDAEIIEV